MNVFDLQAKISLDTKGYESDLKSAGHDFSKFADGLKGAAGKVGDILAGIGKTAAIGVGAAGTALTALTKQTLDAVGSFEQLEGGARKIFDEMDFEKISTDAKNAYKELNMSAAQYLEAINLAGATFAQTMGDEKGYDTARKGMLSIADYASGTGRNLEELNQKYQMITRATSSYQSIADQFSGILPATSADFLEQAQAAGFLADTYEKLTEVPVAEYQQALTNMLERGVDKLGLSNNTLRESTETLTGSFAMAKAAWQNFMTGQGTSKDFVGALNSAIDQTRGKLNEIIPRLTDGLTELVDLLAPEVPPIIEETLPVIIEGSSTLLTALAERLPELLKAILPSLAEGVIDVSTALVEVMPELITSFKESIPVIVNTIMSKKDDLLQAGKDIIKALIPEDFDKIPEIVSGATGFITTFLAKLTEPKNIQAFNNKAFELIGKLVDGLTDEKTLAQLTDSETGVFKIVDNIGNGLVDFADHLLDGIGGLLDNFVEFLSKPENIDRIHQGAIDIVTHLGDGLTSDESQYALGHFLVSFCQLVGSMIAAGGGGANAIDWEEDVGKEIAWKIAKGMWENLKNFLMMPATISEKAADWVASAILGEDYNMFMDEDIGEQETYQRSGTTLQFDEWKEKEKQRKEDANKFEKYYENLSNPNVPDFVKEQMRKHAKGFYASKPAVMSADIVGEDGDEVLLPLEKNTEWMDKFAAKLDRLLMSDDLAATYQTINNDNATTNIVNNSYESPMLGRITQIIDSFGEKVKSNGDYASFRTNLDAEKPDWIMNEPEMPDFTAIEKLTDRLDTIGGNITITGDIIIQAPSSDAEDIAESFIAAIDEKLRNRQMAQDRSTGGTGWK